jgi:hypothetical protein
MDASMNTNKEDQMQDVELDQAKVKVVERDADDIVVRAGTLAVANKKDMDYASAMMSGIKALIEQANDVFDPPIAAAHASHKAALAAKKKITDPLQRALTSVKVKVAAYVNEQERIATAARRAEEERLRKRDEELRLAEALRLEEEGKAEQAEQLIDTPAKIAAPIIMTPPPPKVEGISTAKKYRAEITDVDAFLGWAMAQGSFELFFNVNQSALDRLARERKETLDIPGVKLIVDRVVRSV